MKRPACRTTLGVEGQEFKPRSRPLDSLPSRRGPPIELPQKQDGGRLPPGGLREFLLCPVASRRIREPSEPNYAELLMFLAQRRRGHDTPLQRSFSDPEGLHSVWTAWSNEPLRQAPEATERTGTYGRDSAKVRAAATVCALCGEGPRADDPWVADHRIPRNAGGTDHISNLQPAHRSCNGRKGATMPSWVAR